MNGNKIQTSLLYGKGLFSASSVFLAFPLYRNNASGNGTETRDTIYTEDDNLCTK